MKMLGLGLSHCAWRATAAPTIGRSMGESCEALADAAALLIRVATGPDAAHVAEAEGPGPQPQAEQSEEDAPGANLVDPASPPSAPEPNPEPNPEPKPAPLVLPQRQGPPLEVHARAAGMLQLGALLPGTVAGGAALAAGVSVPWFRAEARGLYLAPRAQTDAANPGVGIDVDGWGVGPSGCGVWDAGRVFVPACLGTQIGRTRARAFGLEQPGVGRGLWAHAVADLTLGVRVSPTVALTAGAEAAVSLLRPSFHVRGFPTLFRTGVAAARGVVGVEVLLRRAPTRELR